MGAMNREQRRHNLKSIQKQATAKILQAPIKPTYGFGITLTNKRWVILLWSRVFTIWKAKK